MNIKKRINSLKEFALKVMKGGNYDTGTVVDDGVKKSVGGNVAPTTFKMHTSRFVRNSDDANAAALVDRHFDPLCGQFVYPINGKLEVISGMLAQHATNDNKFVISSVVEGNHSNIPDYLYNKVRSFRDKGKNVSFVPVRGLAEGAEYEDEKLITMGSVMLAENDPFMRMFSSNKNGIGKGTLRFLPNAKTTKSFKSKIAKLLKTKLGKMNASSYIVQLKKADIVVSEGFYKGPFYTDESDYEQGLFKWAIRASEYFGFNNRAKITDKVYVCIIPEEVLPWDGAGVVLNQRMMSGVANAIRVAEYKNVSVTEDGKVLLGYTGRVLKRRLEDLDSQIESFKKSNNIKKDCNSCWIYNSVIEKIRRDHYRYVARTSVIQVGLYGIEILPDGTLIGELYLRNVMRAKRRAKLGMQTISRLDWTEDSWDEIIGEAETVPHRMVDLDHHLNRGLRIMEGHKILPSEIHTAIRSGNTFTAAEALMNSIREWRFMPGYTGPVLPGDFIVEDDGKAIRLKDNEVGVPRSMWNGLDKDGVASRFPTLEEAHAKNVKIRILNVRTKAIFMGAALFSRFLGDFDGDIGVLYTGMEVHEHPPVIKKTEKFSDITIPSDVDEKEKLLYHLTTIGPQRRMISVPIWDSIHTRLRSIVDDPKEIENIARIFGGRTQIAVDFKTADPDGEASPLNIQLALDEAGYQVDNIIELISLGSIISKYINLKYDVKPKYMNKAEKSVYFSGMKEDRYNNKAIIKNAGRLMMWFNIPTKVRIENHRMAELFSTLSEGLVPDLVRRTSEGYRANFFFPQMRKEVVKSWREGLAVLDNTGQLNAYMGVALGVIADIAGHEHMLFMDKVDACKRIYDRLILDICSFTSGDQPDIDAVKERFAIGVASTLFSRKLMTIVPVILGEDTAFVQKALVDHGFWVNRIS